MHAAIACSPKLITKDFLATDRRVLLFGETGIGKSTLAASLAQTLAQAGHSCICMGADPGSPPFGVHPVQSAQAGGKTMPGGSTGSAGNLADKLLQVTPPQKLAYATDIADTGINRKKLIMLA